MIRVMFDPDELPNIAPGSGVYDAALRWEVTELDLPYDVEARIGWEDGELVCRGLEITQRDGGPQVTAESLRTIPLGTVVKAGTRNFADLLSTVASDEHAETWVKQGPVDMNIKRAANLYRAALATGRPPTRFVMDEMGLPRSTASRWLRRARTMGYLGEATPRKAGG